MNKRNLAILAVAVAAGGGALFSAQQFVKAASSNSTLSSSLASKLNVSEDAVKTALDDVRSEKEAEMETNRKTKYTEELTQAVTDGKLTEDQKTKLLAKYDEVQAKEKELRTQLETLRDDTEQWATDNNIDTQYLAGGLGGPGGKGRGSRGGHMEVNF